MGKLYLFNMYSFCKYLCVINVRSPYGLHGDPIYIYIYMIKCDWLGSDTCFIPCQPGTARLHFGGLRQPGTAGLHWAGPRQPNIAAFNWGCPHHSEMTQQLVLFLQQVEHRIIKIGFRLFAVRIWWAAGIHACNSWYTRIYSTD